MKFVGQEKEKIIKDKVNEEKKLKTATETLGKLNTINESSEAMAMLMTADLATDPKKQEAMYQLMKKQADKEGKSKLNWEEQVKYSGSRANALIMQDVAKGKKDAKGRSEFNEYTGNISWGKESLATTQVQGANKDVLDVMRGGMVNVKSGDVVVDKNSLAQVLGGSPGSAIPFLKGGAAAGGTVPGGNSIVITVNANEKDLGARIANEIKGALYQLNVVGR
jgi:hypothetical protein